MSHARHAIVFDLDGTLVDSLDDITAALAAALVEHGVAPAARDTVRGWIGGGARNMVTRAAPHAIEPVLARFHHYYAASPVTFTHLYDGLAPVLDQLVASGNALAVLTNKPHVLALRIGKALLASWPFQVIAGERAGIPLKPDPAAALQIAAELAIPPARCALVGDTAIDLATARAAGMLPVAVSWGFRPRAELVAAGPAILVDRPAELGRALRRALREIA